MVKAYRKQRNAQIRVFKLGQNRVHGRTIYSMIMLEYEPVFLSMISQKGVLLHFE